MVMFDSPIRSLTDVKSEPAFRKLHDDPRDLALLGKMNLPK
jgi:hypothetical protein